MLFRNKVLLTEKAEAEDDRVKGDEDDSNVDFVENVVVLLRTRSVRHGVGAAHFEKSPRAVRAGEIQLRGFSHDSYL